MPPMRGGVLLALALVAGDGAGTASVTLELRVFNGLEDVTRQTRVAVHRAGDHTSPFVQLSAGTFHAFHRCPRRYLRCPGDS